MSIPQYQAWLVLPFIQSPKNHTGVSICPKKSEIVFTGFRELCNCLLGCLSDLIHILGMEMNIINRKPFRNSQEAIEISFHPSNLTYFSMSFWNCLSPVTKLIAVWNHLSQERKMKQSISVLKLCQGSSKQTLFYSPLTSPQCDEESEQNLNHTKQAD